MAQGPISVEIKNEEVPTVHPELQFRMGKTTRQVKVETRVPPEWMGAIKVDALLTEK